jgi:hypothetical protein
MGKDEPAVYIIVIFALKLKKIRLLYNNLCSITAIKIAHTSRFPPGDT